MAAAYDLPIQKVCQPSVACHAIWIHSDMSSNAMGWRLFAVNSAEIKHLQAHTKQLRLQVIERQSQEVLVLVHRLAKTGAGQSDISSPFAGRKPVFAHSPLVLDT